MSIRTRIFLVIVLFAVIIVVIGVGVGWGIMKMSFVNAMENELAITAQIADDRIGAEIDTLKDDANTISIYLEKAPQPELEEVLQEKLLEDDYYVALTLLSYDGITASAGELTAAPEIMDAPFVQDAFHGEKTISGTQIHSSGELVFYICVPMGDQVLLATLPGMYFRDLLQEYVIWETGHLFIDDKNGTVVSNPRTEWVLKQYNFIELAKTEPQYEGIAESIVHMISGKPGFTRFEVEGVERIVVYRPIENSPGWSVGVVAPVVEAPTQNVFRGVLLIAAICMALVIFFSSITSVFLERPYKRIQNLKEVAEHASASKSEFLSNMSHEIRTPIHAIIGMTAIGKSAPEIERKDNCFEKIDSASSHLLGIINDILDMSKIEANKMKLYPVDFEFSTMIQRILSVTKFTTEEKNLHFHTEISKEIPNILFGDEQRLSQVITNLISNAVKFTPENGDITLKAQLLSKSEGVCEIRIDLIDTGIGITEEQKTRLFDSFEQADAGTTRKFGGTGLGLTISKQIVEMMGGKLGVESEIDKGSDFSFNVKLPISQAVLENETEQSESALFKQYDFSGKRVLLAEDIEINREIVIELLTPTKLMIDCAMNGKEAVALFSENPNLYDCILMDVQMPEMNGYEATEHIRAMDDPKAKTIPIIAMTANVFREDIEKCLEAGMTEHIGKPIKIDHLLKVLHQNF